MTYSQAGGSPLKYNLEETNHVSNSSQSALCATIDYQMTRFDVRLGADRSFSLNGYDYEATEKVSLQPAAPKRVIAFLESETEGSDLVGGIYSDTTEQKNGNFTRICHNFDKQAGVFSIRMHCSLWHQNVACL